MRKELKILGMGEEKKDAERKGILEGEPRRETENKNGEEEQRLEK